ncbi:uncharacterized protein M6B38_309275 [Iris pallida]|uniref:CCHC-type domain-containing protein n=1 Tax=Iris pallida TaxID=29817 RepID=A0AAX6HIN4_IRIPA|nr:uncharacterized protein M6B38_309275 [Iris pallida]
METRSHRLDREDTTEGSATPRPDQQGPETAAPVMPAQAGISAAYGSAPLPTPRLSPVIPNVLQQQSQSGSEDMARLFSFFQQIVETQRQQLFKRGHDIHGVSSSGGQAKRPHVQIQHQYQQGPVQQHLQGQGRVYFHQASRQQQDARYNFCKKAGHGWNDCRMRLVRCLLCGSAEHRYRECPESQAAMTQVAAGARAPTEQPRGPPLQTQQTPRQQHVTSCPFCRKPGYDWSKCRMRLGKCLLCGASYHQLRECAKFPGRTAQGAGARAPVSQQKGLPLQNQQQRFVQHQVGGGQQGRASAMATEGAQAVGELIADDFEELCPTYYGAGLDDTLELDLQEDPALADDTTPID